MWNTEKDSMPADLEKPPPAKLTETQQQTYWQYNATLLPTLSPVQASLPLYSLFPELLDAATTHPDAAAALSDSGKHSSDQALFAVEKGQKRAEAGLRAYSNDMKLMEQWRFICCDFKNYGLKHARILKFRIRQGVPDSLRGYVWQQLASSREYLQKVSPRLYHQLCMQPHAQFEGDILRDIARTFPKHMLFKDKSSQGQHSLFRVLRAYSLHNPDVGYCQGMGFLSGVLLLHMNEEDTFLMLISILDRYEMAGLFKPGLPLLEKFLYQFERVFKSHIPRLYNHLKRENIDPTMYASQWFMTFFSYSFPLDVVVRIFDVFLAEGVKMLFRVAVAILKLLQETLFSQSFEAALQTLKLSTKSFDVEKLMQTALNIKIRQSTLLEIAREYEWKRLKPL